MRIISVLWHISPSGCNFYPQSSPCISGSDPYEYQPVSLVRATRPSWQSRAELSTCTRTSQLVLLFLNQEPSQLPSTSRGEIELWRGKHNKPVTSSETKWQGWGKETPSWRLGPTSLFCVWEYLFEQVMVFSKQLQCEDSLACS